MKVNIECNIPKEIKKFLFHTCAIYARELNSRLYKKNSPSLVGESLNSFFKNTKKIIITDQQELSEMNYEFAKMKQCIQHGYGDDFDISLKICENYINQGDIEAYDQCLVGMLQSYNQINSCSL